MSSIFVSYRRTDVPGHAGRLYDRLVDRFGRASVFKDLDSMEPGADFGEVIEETVGRCDALVAVIGRDWLASERGGRRRLDDPQDWVRLEIANALKRRIRVVPVLVAGAQMPSAVDLPEDLHALARRHAVELTETAWAVQVDQLIDALERSLALPGVGSAPASRDASIAVPRKARAEHPRERPPDEGLELQEIRLPAEAFVVTTQQVLPAASKDETRPVLTGVLVAVSGDELRMVATDSFRMAIKETRLEEPIAPGMRFEGNVPARVLERLAAVVNQNAAQRIVITNSNDGGDVFRVGGVTLPPQLIEGAFPDYRHLLPQAYEYELRMRVDQVLGVVRRFGLMATSNAPLRLVFREGELTLSMREARTGRRKFKHSIGEVSERLSVPFSGEPFEIGLDPKFLGDGLASVVGGDFVLKLNGPLLPALIEDGNGFRYLIMPVRLED